MERLCCELVAGGKEEDPEQVGKTVLWWKAERTTWTLEWQRTELAGGDSSETATLYRNRLIMLKKKVSLIVIYRK